jgi:hypothetical protein
MVNMRWLVLLPLLTSVALARDNGQWAQKAPEIRSWFNSLTNSAGGPCCLFADGVSIDDPDWRIKTDGTYQVFYHAQWRDVPPEAMIHSPNRIGHAVLWPVDYPATGNVSIRCFMPGTES